MHVAKPVDITIYWHAVLYCWSWIEEPDISAWRNKSISLISIFRKIRQRCMLPTLFKSLHWSLHKVTLGIIVVDWIRRSHYKFWCVNSRNSMTNGQQLHSWHQSCIWLCGSPSHLETHARKNKSADATTMQAHVVIMFVLPSSAWSTIIQGSTRWPFWVP